MCYTRFLYIFLFYLAKAKTHQFTQLENKIQSLQNLQKQHFTEQQATQLSSLKEEYDLLSHSKANLFYIGLGKNIISNQRDLVIYWPLGWKNASLRHISAIKSSDDQVTTNPVAINEYLKVFTQICIKPKQILMNQFVSSI